MRKPAPPSRPRQPRPNPIEDLGARIDGSIAWAVAVAIAVAVFLVGCAGSLSETVDRAEVALVALDVAIESKSPAWLAYVEAQVAVCKAKGVTTRAEGVACLGPAAKAAEVEAALEAVTKGQAAALEALEALRKVAPLLEAARSSSP